MKVWGKTVKKEKITRDIIFETENFHSNFDGNLAELCHMIDIPTPIATRTHKGYFEQFNIVKFKKDDFVESVDFDYFELEFVPENRKKTARNYY